MRVPLASTAAFGPPIAEPTALPLLARSARRNGDPIRHRITFSQPGYTEAIKKARGVSHSRSIVDSGLFRVWPFYPLHPLYRLRPGRFGKMSAADAETPSAFFADGAPKGGKGGKGGAVRTQRGRDDGRFGKQPAMQGRQTCTALTDPFTSLRAARRLTVPRIETLPDVHYLFFY